MHMQVHVAAKLRQERVQIDARKAERTNWVFDHAIMQGVVDIITINVIVLLDGLECRIAQVLIDLIWLTQPSPMHYEIIMMSPVSSP